MNRPRRAPRSTKDTMNCYIKRDAYLRKTCAFFQSSFFRYNSTIALMTSLEGFNQLSNSDFTSLNSTRCVMYVLDQHTFPHESITCSKSLRMAFRYSLELPPFMKFGMIKRNRLFAGRSIQRPPCDRYRKRLLIAFNCRLHQSLQRAYLPL